MVSPKYPLFFSVAILLQNEIQSFKMYFQEEFTIFVSAVFIYPDPKLSSFQKSIFETEHQEALSDCIIMRLNHETCKALMKVFIFVIQSPPAVTSFMISLLLILSGPEFHRNL